MLKGKVKQGPKSHRACMEAAKAQRPAIVSMWRVSVVVDSKHLDEPQTHAPK